ncbi:MAG: CPBP family intramembrane metalloprotease [Colwelliaceae bacterium]|jgi:membrane protease YdiL (CAAX protease family)|nr:CPBP family intramembrane metalloprotease [Colwelliaceae bacterium]
MLGIIILLLISWLLLHFFMNQNLSILGIQATTSRLKEFITGFLFTLILCSVAQVLDSIFKEISWSINSDISVQLLVKATWWDFKSVLYEELFFRGALLYILFKKLGINKSILISSILFGIYHWFSYGVFGRIIPMLIIFLGTGIMGYAWGLAYSKTKSIILPFALHFGWNFTQNTIFSKGPLGQLLLAPSNGVELTGLMSLFNFLIPMLLMPIITFLYVKLLVKEKSKLL